MEKTSNTKTYIISISIAIAAFIGGTQASTINQPVDSLSLDTPESTSIQITLSSELVDDLGRPVYRIHEGLYAYDFISYEQIEKFANTPDPNDDEATKNVRLVVKQELQTQTAEEFFNSIKQ